MAQTVFIVRPFGARTVGQGTFDFDAMERDLIMPAIGELGLAGGTTGEIVRSGDIRSDMLELLVVADLVIADISIHNANVYYELGVRHALRNRPTIMIRMSRTGDDVPFDIKADRYFGYDRDDPASSLPGLKAVISETLRSSNVDSPVYEHLGDLEPPDRRKLHAVPAAFREAVAVASAGGDLAMLNVLAMETRGCRWWVSGLGLVGRALFDRGAHVQAIRVWEKVREGAADLAHDPQANLLLATSYQRQDRLDESDAAIERVLSGDVPPRHRAEALALKGRNLKTRWRRSWSPKPKAERRAAALSSLLVDSSARYYDAFLEDLSSYYSGINALAGCVMILDLAASQPEGWAARFDDDGEAARELSILERRRDDLSGAVKLALEAAKRRRGRRDFWLDLTVADHQLLTSDRLARVRRAYADARERNPIEFNLDSAVRQLDIYVALGIRAEQTGAALEGLEADPGAVRREEAPPEPPPRDLVIVSTGHRIDAPGRSSPRFPATCETAAREAIRREVEGARDACRGKVTGLSGLASGSDILFHEICRELGIPAEAALALPENDFLAASVQDAGSDWVDRYRDLCRRLDPPALSQDEKIPEWIADPERYSVFQRCNLWMLESALARPDTDVTLIAFWNKQTGDGPGGTEDMVAIARECGAKVVVIDSNDVCR